MSDNAEKDDVSPTSLSMESSVQATNEIILLYERSKAQLERIINALPELLFILDSKGRILKANSAAEKLLGAGEGEATLRSISELFSESSYHFLVSKFDQIGEGTDDGLEFELSVDNKDRDQKKQSCH